MFIHGNRIRLTGLQYFFRLSDNGSLFFYFTTKARRTPRGNPSDFYIFLNTNFKHKFHKLNTMFSIRFLKYWSAY